jgi:hypothetical protein
LGRTRKGKVHYQYYRVEYKEHGSLLRGRREEEKEEEKKYM